LVGLLEHSGREAGAGVEDFDTDEALAVPVECDEPVDSIGLCRPLPLACGSERCNGKRPSVAVS
jgi:hypothetical protein